MKHISQLARSELVEAKLSSLIKIRLPWLVIGLAGSFVVSIIVSHFEVSLRETIALAFFIPIIANMSDGIGTQTETILIRALADLKFNIVKYILREAMVGAILGFFLGILAGVFAYLLSGSMKVGLVVGLSILVTLTTSTILACLAPVITKHFGRDPAVVTGPFTTSLQDLVSLTIYLLIASVIL